ncbi:hypothetical protein C7974DRAFT_402202 [Boeremia exigua]|uniref:uncharacterized protein n=1 Tax=Boeremia exigua TaxID=749465 RepID=UPI001E8D82CA|nr:uncharacterized protein C7974DRAFT_402202 [Boeremia exigua]KAH6616654.1 hypothetical protein C7974DRAFT_402202 [Boeremia exigua]
MLCALVVLLGLHRSSAERVPRNPIRQTTVVLDVAELRKTSTHLTTLDPLQDSQVVCTCQELSMMNVEAEALMSDDCTSVSSVSSSGGRAMTVVVAEITDILVARAHCFPLRTSAP